MKFEFGQSLAFIKAVIYLHVVCGTVLNISIITIFFSTKVCIDILYWTSFEFTLMMQNPTIIIKLVIVILLYQSSLKI